MAANTKNKFPADKSGSKYADFRNTRRFTETKTKVKSADISKQASSEPGAGKTS